MHAVAAWVCRGALLVAACGCARRQPTPELASAADSSEVPAGPASLEVENLSYFDVNIFVIQGSRNWRMGMVTATRTTRFKLTPEMIGRGPIQIYAEPIGSPKRLRSEEIPIRAGETLSWAINSELRDARVIIR